MKSLKMAVPETSVTSEVHLEALESSNDFVVPCSSESLHLFHSLSPKKRLQFHCYELLLLQVQCDPLVRSTEVLLILIGTQPKN